MMPDSENRVWGISCNPYDITRTTGGSSGGEGALIASHCSVMGLGSDIGNDIVSSVLIM
jgi:Asp-tRNA(Asn)/Glu-tRNA(Gln) amidotransferase A subunit family amidase